MSKLIINQTFRLLLSIEPPQEVEEIISWFVAITNEQIKKKKRMHQDLWFFKNNSSVKAHTSYWKYRDQEDHGFGCVRTTNWDESVVYCHEYNLRNTHSICGNRFITWKDGLFMDDSVRSTWGEAYEILLFEADGETTESFRMLYPTEKFIESAEGLSNRGVFLREPDNSPNPLGITILNIISKAMDGIYYVEWSLSGFSGDDKGEYHNDVITIYNKTPTKYGTQFKKFIADEYDRWITDPDGMYTGLIIGGRDEDDLSNIMERTEEGEIFFSIFLKPNWNDIMGGSLAGNWFPDRRYSIR
jgi:hypothetical protein